MCDIVHAPAELHDLPDDGQIRHAAEIVAQPGSPGFKGEIRGSMAEFSAEYMGYIEEYLDADLLLVADRVLARAQGVHPPRAARLR